MIETLTTSEIEYLFENVSYDDIVTYCSVHREVITHLSTPLAQEAKEQFLIDVAHRQEQYDADAFDAAQKELVRALYHLRRGTIMEAERMELLRPFFPDLTQRYSVLLDENIPESEMMTFERLLATIERLYDQKVMQVFDDWEDCRFLNRSYLKRYAAYVKDSEAFICLYHHGRDRTVRRIKRYSGKISTVPECMGELDSYKAQMRDSLNIILLAIYLDQEQSAYHYMDTEQLNMYQGFEMEMDLEEALDALFSLKNEVDRYKDKATRRIRPLRSLLSLLGR